jgi:EF-P beta-lysylation protein EpmB
MNAVHATLAPATWQQAMAGAYTAAEDLLRDLGLDPGNAGPPVAGFPIRVPRGYAARMRRGDARDPLLLQVLPQLQEFDDVAGYTTDPVGELASIRQPGLLQKYAGRVLVVTTGACAVHCRYCFRRAFPYGDHLSGRQLDTLLDDVRADASIREVILSGGDPLSLSDRRLAALLGAIEQIPHVQRIRLHTRAPIVLPERVDAGLSAVLAGLRKPLVTVLHCNHANEIDDRVAAGARVLRRYSATLLNQAVLLRGINDTPDALVTLSEALFGIGVLPYYLHQLDQVAGAAHFSVSDRRARVCVARAAARLPGYLVPRLVREIPGAKAKTPL